MKTKSNIFGSRLLSLREARNITQQELADAIGITRQSLSHYEMNERTVNAETIYQIAEFFGVSADYLLGLTDNMTTHTDLKAVCDYTGLDENAVKSIVNFNKNRQENEKAVFNQLLTDISQKKISQYEPDIKISPYGYMARLISVLISTNHDESSPSIGETTTQDLREYKITRYFASLWNISIINRLRKSRLDEAGNPGKQ